MDTRNAPHVSSRISSGVRTAAFIVILGAVAVAADHAFFVAPRMAAPAAEAIEPVAASVPIDGFALPDHLRHLTDGDVTPTAPTF